MREPTGIPPGDICGIRPRAKPAGFPFMSCVVAGVNPRPEEGDGVQSLGITPDKLVRFLINFVGGTGAVSLAGVLASLSPHALAIDTHLPFLAISGTALLVHSDDFTMRVLTTVAVLIQTRVEGRAIVSRGRNPVSSRQAAVYGHQ